MKITIFGATGPTGRLLLQQGLSANYDYTITAMVRRPEALDLTHERLKVLQGDLFDAASVEQAIVGQDAVITVFGGTYTTKLVTVYSVGIKHIIEAMEKHNVQRLLALTSSGANPHYDPKEGFFFGRIIKPFIGKRVYEDMRRMEATIQSSNLDWTIVRPARLINTAAISGYRVGPGYILPRGGTTARIDLADFLLKEVQRNQYLKEGVAIAVADKG